MVLQIINFYEKQLGREISDAEQEAVRTMHEEFRRLRAPDHFKEEGGLLAQMRPMRPHRETLSEAREHTSHSL